MGSRFVYYGLMCFTGRIFWIKRILFFFPFLLSAGLAQGQGTFDTEAVFPPQSSAFTKVDKKDCGFEDIREHFQQDSDGSLKKFFSTPRLQGYFDLFPAKDQDVGMCFAISAADLLSIEVHHPVSGLGLFFEYEKRRQNLVDLLWRYAQNTVTGWDASPVTDGGFTYWSLKEAYKKQDPDILCPEELLPSSHSLDIPGESAKARSLHDGVDLPASLRSLITSLKVPPYYLARDESIEQVAVRLEAYLRDAQLDQVFKGLDDGTQKDPEGRRQQILSAITRIIAQDSSHGKNIYGILVDLTHASCDRGRALQLPPGGVPKYFEYDSSNMIDNINQLLDVHRALAVYYDSGFTRQNKPVSGIFGTHWSVLIGRQWNDAAQTCEYHIRDSLFGYDGSKYRTDTVRYQAEDGTYWVSDETLWKMSYSIAYVSKASDKPLIKK